MRERAVQQSRDAEASRAYRVRDHLAVLLVHRTEDSGRTHKVPGSATFPADLIAVEGGQLCSDGAYWIKPTHAAPEVGVEAAVIGAEATT